MLPDYSAALEEIHNICKNGSWRSENSSSPVLMYLQREGGDFAGNFSTQKRRSFFDHRDDGVAVPCGFLHDFFVRESDREAMEQCVDVVVVTAIFGDHDKVRQPKGLGSKTLETVCFFIFIDDSTLKGFNSHNILAGAESNIIGVWRVIHLFSGDLPYNNPAMNGVIPKHLIHRLFPNSKFSIWLDAKLQLTVDPLLLLHSLLISKNADMAVSKHPVNVHTMEEAMATARWRKWRDIESLRLQMEAYCENGLQPWTPSKLPYTTGNPKIVPFLSKITPFEKKLVSLEAKSPLSIQKTLLFDQKMMGFVCEDVPDTALILRRHGLSSNLFSCLLFNELVAFNPRDQLAFAYVRDMMSPRITINMFEVEVFEQVAVEYRHNLRKEGSVPEEEEAAPAPAQHTRSAVPVDLKGSKCEKYLLKMWGESYDDNDGG